MIKIKKLVIINVIIFLFITVMVLNIDYNAKNSILTVYIDPGHGGIDGGTVGHDGTIEKDINLQVSLRLKKVLEDHNIKVLLTRDGDYDLAGNSSTIKSRKTEDIHKRVELISKSNCDLYISIHCNAYTSTQIKGAQVFYKSGDDIAKILADKIQEQLIIELQNSNRVAKSITNKYLIDHTTKTGCIIEVGFLSNEEELNLLKKELYQERIAYSIYYGIIEYLNS